MNDEKIIEINVNLTRGLAVVLVVGLLAIALLGYLAFGHEEAAASSPQLPVTSSAGVRQYYLGSGWYDPTEAPTACTSGYHFASLWEILDPSNLKYNTNLGSTRSDSGSGPPTNMYGLVRTGFNSGSSETAGIANCYSWTSTTSTDKGTLAGLVYNWTSGKDDKNAWEFLTLDCNLSFHVWCVED